MDQIIADAREKFVARGLCPLAVVAEDKRPIGTGWQIASVDELARRFVPGCWIGLRLGAQPDGRRLLALDDDEGGALADLEREIGPLPPTLTQRTTRGEHRVFTVPDDGHSYAGKLRGRKVDVLCDGRQIVVCPSPGRTWLDAREPVPLPEAWLEALRKPVAAPLPVDAPRGPGKAPSKRSWADYVHRVVSDPNDTNRLSGAWGSACAKHCGWTNEQIAQGLRANFGVADTKLEKHINDAQRAADTTREGGRVPGLPSLAELGVVFTLEDAVEWPANPDDAGLETVFGRRWTGGEIEITPVPAIDWVCERWAIAPGAPVVMGGPAGLGKTLIAQALALAVATPGAQWLGCPVRHGRVVHIDHEQGLEGTMRRYQRLGIRGAEGLELRCPPAGGWRLSSPRGLEFFEKAAEGAALVIVDSLRASSPGIDENDSNIRTLLDPLGEVAARTGAAVLVIHHARKNGDEGDDASALRGSSGIPDAASAVIRLARKDDAVEMWLAKIRDPGDSTYDLFLKRTLRIARAAEGLSVCAVGSRETALEAIRRAPDGLSARDIHAITSGLRDADKRAYYYETHPDSKPRGRSPKN